ncbi:MAG TPA: hypothetical protein VGH60_03615 [Solirubrobacteraceae bacterium]
MDVTVGALGSAMHPGMFGGPAPDPVAGLLAMLASMRDERGNTTIDGVENSGSWDGVDYLPEQFRADAQVLDGVDLVGSGSMADMLWARPTVTILGIGQTDDTHIHHQRRRGDNVMRGPGAVCLAMLCVISIMLGACSSSSANAVSEPSATTAASAKSSTDTTTEKTTTQPTTVTQTKTVTPPTQTKTVTAPTQTNTVIKTQTTPTAQTTSTETNGNGAAAALAAAAAQGKGPEEGDEGLPGWAWGLIGAGAAGLLAWAIVAYRGRHRHAGSGPPRDGGGAGVPPLPPEAGPR